MVRISWAEDAIIHYSSLGNMGEPSDIPSISPSQSSDVTPPTHSPSPSSSALVTASPSPPKITPDETDKIPEKEFGSIDNLKKTLLEELQQSFLTWDPDDTMPLDPPKKSSKNTARSLWTPSPKRKHDSVPRDTSQDLLIIQEPLTESLRKERDNIRPGPLGPFSGELLSRMLATFSDFEDLESLDGIYTASCSDVTELELEKEILIDKWRVLFDQFDTEGFGEILWQDFGRVLTHPDFVSEINASKRQQLILRMATSSTNAITFQEFANILSGKRSRSLKCAVHQRDREISSENDFHLETEKPTLFKRMVHIIGNEFLTDEKDRKYHADHYKCWPPPLFIFTVTIIQLCVFGYYTLISEEMQFGGPVPLDAPFIYRPDKRYHVWRFFLYAFLHAGWLHLAFNLLVQVLVGIPLEMVHGSSRIGSVYMAGVLAGSLGTSVFDSEVFLVGASGGVYALLAAHLANVLLNFNSMKFAAVKLVIVIFIASADVGYAIYDRYAHVSTGLPVSYVSHLTGAVAGLTIGLVVLKNFEQKLHEQLLWWVSLGTFAGCVLFAIVFNLLHTYPYRSLQTDFL